MNQASPIFAACGGWGVSGTPNPGFNSDELVGVAAASATSVWAVGDYSSGKLQTLIEHGKDNGTVATWTTKINPNPGADDYLNGVAAVSATNVWAVGTRVATTSFLNHTLIEHWNGTRWSVVPSANAGTNQENHLYGAAAVSASDVWAVGFHIAGQAQTLTEHWDGTSWRVVPSPNGPGGGNQLRYVVAVSASDVWAVGFIQLDAQGNVLQTLIEHWDGTSWRVVSSPNPSSAGFNELFGVTAVSASDVWAVGSYGIAGQSEAALIEHWNGTSWNVVPGAGIGGAVNGLLGTTAISANDVWAVGGYRSAPTVATQNLTEHWDGTSWNVVPSPSVGTQSALFAVAAHAPHVWAVGTYTDASGHMLTLAERFC